MRPQEPDFASVMASGGRYAAGAATQRGAADVGLALIPAALDGVEIAPDGPPLLTADFGAADGANSLVPMGTALRQIRRRAPTRPVVAVHADIVGNDFGALAATLEAAPNRYDREDANVLPVMAARSLFGPVLPPASLVFGWTASTVHWLSRPLGPVPDHFFVQLSGDAEARRRYCAQSARDWTDFLAARAAELVPGASVVVVDVLMDDDGVMGAEALFDLLGTALTRCRDDGTLSADEYANMVYPTWFRSRTELSAPFAPDFTAPEGQRLQLGELREVVEPDPFGALLHDPTGYAAAQVDFLRGFLEPSFAAALDPGRKPHDAAVALDRLWSTARELIAADPAAVAPAYRLIALRVQRVG